MKPLNQDNGQLNQDISLKEINIESIEVKEG